MKKVKNKDQVENRTSSLTEDKVKSINSRVEFELNEMQFKMTKVGGIANILGGSLLVWIQYHQISNLYLFTWYVFLLFFNLLNIGFPFYYAHSHVAPSRMKKWLNAYHYIIMLPVALIWGIAGVLVLSADLNHQLYTVILLVSVLVCFSFGTITDFITSVISICGIVLPSLLYRLYLSIQQFGNDTNLNLGISICLFILGTFLSIGCYIGYKLIKKSINLTYMNVFLKNELEKANKFLEQRVKERTVELEKSLNLVTYQATHDLLTDLPNQRSLLEHLQSSIQNAKQQHYAIGLVFFTINEMEKINDGLGYHAGDRVIKTIAQRFRNLVDKSLSNASKIQYKVMLSRKDVFVILLEPIHLLDEAEAAAETFFAIVDEPVHTEKQPVKLTASMGLSFYPRDAETIETLLMNADAAMLIAKKQGGNNISIHVGGNRVDISQQLEMERGLHTAIKNQEFVLQYQPFVDLKTGKICGMEALVRWKHPSLGYISPANFIPLAETNGIIVPLGEWVLRTACLQTKMWHDRGFNQLKIAVNLSAKQLQQKNILSMIQNILAETKINPESVELELTETEVFQSDFIDIIKEFKKMRLSLSIDDFGTGYSGLSNLKLFSIDKLKIDKTFVTDLMVSDHSKAIIENTINLAKKLNVKVLAEGVESKEQLNFLIEHKCDMIQGYYFSPPINTEIFTQLLENKVVFTI